MAIYRGASYLPIGTLISLDHFATDEFNDQSSMRAIYEIEIDGETRKYNLKFKAGLVDHLHRVNKDNQTVFVQSSRIKTEDKISEELKEFLNVYISNTRRFR